MWNLILPYGIFFFHISIRVLILVVGIDNGAFSHVYCLEFAGALVIRVLHGLEMLPPSMQN